MIVAYYVLIRISIMTTQGKFKPVLSGGALVGLDPPNCNVKHYKSVEILSDFQNVKPIWANAKPPIEDFLATVLVQPSHHFARRFHCFRFSAV